jgi:carboxypeptidase family protein
MKRAKILPISFLCGVIAITFVTQLSPSIAAQTPKRNGAITGRVVTADGQPTSEATVMAYAIGSSEAESQKVECDDEGRFKLSGLKPGSYIISASMPGYVSLNDTSGAEIHRIGENVTLTLVKGGVITGRVTDVDGEPIEGARVDLRMGRDVDGRISGMPDYSENIGTTDDRGVYRIYGLPQGKYLVRVMDTLPSEYRSSSFRHGAPTYYPSANRAAAAEITVRAGEEVTGIDIRYLGQREHSISGVISGEVESESPLGWVSVTLRDEASGEVLGSTEVIGSRNFALYGVVDGAYELVAQRLDEESSDTAISAPRQVTVKGADITGVNLKLLKPASISGRLAIESPKSGGACGQPEKFSVEEISLQIMKSGARDHMQNNWFSEDRDEEGHLTAPNEKGQFVQKNLEEGIYRIISDLPDDYWYIRSLTQTSKGGPGKGTDIVRNGISLTPGEKLTGVEMIVGRGAARLHGQVSAANGPRAKEGAPTSLCWRVHILPAEETAAEDLLRYAETVTRSDGSFELKHLAPGKYLLLAREIPEKEGIEDQYGAVAWDHVKRAKLHREAQALGQEIEIRPCQQINDYALRLSVKPK